MVFVGIMLGGGMRCISVVMNSILFLDLNGIYMGVLAL